MKRNARFIGLVVVLTMLMSFVGMTHAQDSGRFASRSRMSLQSFGLPAIWQLLVRWKSKALRLCS